MKIGKLHNKSGLIKVLLGLAIAGALLFASCQGIFDTADIKSQPQDDGYGYVVVDLGGSERTIWPETDVNGVIGFTKYIYTFTGVDVPGVVEEYDSTATYTNPFRLPAGKYELTVQAWTAANASAAADFSAEGVGKDKNGNAQFQIVIGDYTYIYVTLTPRFSSSADGKLTVSIKTGPLTGEIATGVYTLKQLMGTGTWGNDILASLSPTTTNGLSLTAASLPAGTYLFTGRINTNKARYGGFSEAIHIASNATTTFIKDYTEEDALAQVTTSQEAIEILKDEILNWGTTGVTPTLAGILASTSDKIQFSDDVSTIAANTIRLNYIAETTTLGSTFPITLQGGWQPATGSSWVLNKFNESIIVKLENTNITTGTPDAPITYNVELRPVAEYQVAYYTDVEQTGRAITITDGATASVSLSSAAGTAAAPKKGIGAVGDSVITIPNSALSITINPNITTNAPLDSTTNSYTLPAVSRVYRLMIYEDAATQTRNAFQRLRDNISTTTPATSTSPAIPAWVTDTSVLARGDKANRQQDLDLKPSPTADGVLDTVYLYYVESKLKDAVGEDPTGYYKFPIRFPLDDNRWDVVPNNWQVAKDATSTGTAREIGFTPFGGTRQTYDIKLIPVVEFEVTFATTTPPTGVTADPATWVPPSTGKISIKDATAASTAGDYTVLAGSDTSGGKRYDIGNQTITLTDVSIQIDETTEGGALENAYNPAPIGGAQPTNSANVAKTSYTITAATSRVYKIKVYKSVADQLTAAVTKIQSDTTSAAARAWTDLANNVRVEPFEVVSPATTPPTSNLVYVNATEPGVNIPSSYSTAPTGSTPDPGWNSITKTTAGTSLTDSSYEALINFTPKGGVAEDIYKLKLIPAAELNISFAEYPFGTNTLDGSVTVTANKPVGGALSGGPYTAANPAVDVLAGIGTANPLSIAATSISNIYGYKSDFSSSTLASTDTFVGIVPATTLTSKKYYINVYPPKNKQTENVLANIKEVQSLDNWGTGISTVDAVKNTGTTPTDTTFRVVSSTLPTTLVAPSTPSPYIRAPYSLSVTPGAVTAADPTKGIRDDLVRFTALSGTPGTGTTAGTDDMIYTFKLVQVAKIYVEFKAGPTIPANLTYGNIQITTFEPGTGVLATTPQTIWAATPTKFMIVGTSTTANSGSFIGTTQDNVFRLGDSGPYTNGADANVANQTLPFTTVSSREYTIEVYPTVEEQKRQVLEKLKAETDTTGWFTTSPAGTPANTTTVASIMTPFKPVTGNISEVQYYGRTTAGSSVAPVFVVGGKANYFNPGYTISIGNATANVTSTCDVSFTPLGGSVVTAIYTFKTIPLAKYTVVYSETAQGTITVGPDPANTFTSSPYGAAFSINKDDSNKSNYLQINGNTKIDIKAASGDFQDVVIREGNEIAGTQRGDTLYYYDATATPTSKLSTNFTPVVSTEYFIRVFKP